MKKGITLIELLILISILGILGSVIIASIRSAKEKNELGAIPIKSVRIVESTDNEYKPVTDSSRTASCINGYQKERERAQERFSREMDDISDRINRMCFNAMD